MKKPKVLLVDDEEEFVSTLVERLEFRGIPAKGVTTGQAALDCLRRESFEVVVVDLKMPSIDGLQIKRVIEGQYPGTRVILVTGHGRQGVDEGPAGAETDVLMKPFDIRALLERIQESTKVGER